VQQLQQFTDTESESGSESLNFDPTRPYCWTSCQLRRVLLQ